MVSRDVVALALMVCVATRLVMLPNERRILGKIRNKVQRRQRQQMTQTTTIRSGSLIEEESALHTTIPIPLQVLEQYKQWHSVGALQRDPRNRKFAIGFYSCPLQAGNRIHHFMDSLKWAILTNRTLLWKYWDGETCTKYNNGQSHISVCDNANKLEDCDKMLARADWIPSYDEWSQTLSLEEHHVFPWEATHYEPPPRIIVEAEKSRKAIEPQLDARGVDLEGKYPHQVAVFEQFRNKQDEMSNSNVREALLQTDWGRQTAHKLHDLGVDFLYGMLYRQSFELRERFRGSSTNNKKSTSPFSFALHSRHIRDKMNGCNIRPEIQCMKEFLKDVPPAQEVWATLMSDRTCTIDKLRKWLETRNVTVEIAQHDTGESYRAEHGPFAGVGFFQDVEVASQARHAFAGTKNGKRQLKESLLRSSSNLPLEVMEYEKRMEAWEASQDPTEVKATTICVMDHLARG